jgi:outer membrane immunogenic protein
MKRKLSAVAAMVAALFAGSASAADLPLRKEPPPAPLPPPPPTWNGLYLGLNIGGGWKANNNDNFNYFPFVTGVGPFGTAFPAFGFGAYNYNNNNNQGGVVGGGQVGYNYQFANSFLVGLEADIQGTSIGSNNNNNNWNSWWWGADINRRGLPWFGTVRGRLGFLLMPSLLVYGTGGFAYGGVEYWDQTRTRAGWTAGGGLEYLIWQNWSVKVEYLYVDLVPNNNYNYYWGAGGWCWGHRRDLQANIVRAGLNWHFNFSQPPVLARY